MGGMGGMGAPGGPGGAPGGPGGEMGGGMGGMPGMGGEMAPPGAIPGMGPAPAATQGKIMKKGKGGGSEEQSIEQQVGYLKFTKIEQKMAAMLSNLNEGLKTNLQIFPQFPVENPQGGKPYALDFAFPKIKLGIEADGEFHTMVDQQAHDKQRDFLLARRGWTILRFDEQAIEESPQAVEQTIAGYIKKATQQQDKKVASTGSPEDNIKLYTFKSGKLTCLDIAYEKYYKVIYSKSYDQVSDTNKWGQRFDSKIRTGMLHKQ